VQGYKKYRRALFQKENLIPQAGTENEKHSDKKKETEALVGALSSDAGDHKEQKSFDFHSKEECSKVNKELGSASESVLFIYIHQTVTVSQRVTVSRAYTGQSLKEHEI